ncbi:MAG: VOC family protein [Minwuia sp.]|uniref:VOC family protein n=1 Tax=Minwuia sp. TaxID=2493630 RepID=UPI003A89D963
MSEHLHHVHLFAADLDATIGWWREHLGGEVAFDGEFGGSRNVFMRVGSGRIHFYDQPLRDEGRGAVHHIGIRTGDLAALEERLRRAGIAFRSGIRDFGAWKYIMCPAPDGVLLELFQADPEKLEGDAARYFADWS